MATKPVKEYEVIPFQTAQEFRHWLHSNHTTSPGIWLKMFKKATGIPSITYQEALREALCYGWIDGQSKSGDEQFWIQKFTPRRPKGMWSKRNITIIEELTNAGMMQPAGIAEVEAAKADGRWAQAYDSPSNAKVPQDFLDALSKDPKAEAFFQTLNKTNTYFIAFQLQTAKKPETRTLRLEKLLTMMKKGEKIH